MVPNVRDCWHIAILSYFRFLLAITSEISCACNVDIDSCSKELAGFVYQKSMDFCFRGEFFLPEDK